MIFLLLTAIILAIPVLTLVFILRALGTVVDGLRSINATTLRMAESLDVLADAQRPRDRY